MDELPERPSPVDNRGGETFRVRRQEDWQHMTPEEVADSAEAQRHPTNLTAFVDAYSPYVDVKFVVLHQCSTVFINTSSLTMLQSI